MGEAARAAEVPRAPAFSALRSSGVAWFLELQESMNPQAAVRPESAQEGVVAEPSAPQTRKTVIAVRGDETGAPETSAADRILTFTAPDAPKGSRQILIGWVPGRGNDRNATATDAFEW